MKKTIFLLMTAFILILTFAGCGSKESELVGRWVQTTDDSIEFFKDNTYVTDEGKHTSNPSSVSGTYEITDDGRLKLNETDYAELYAYTIKNNKLTLKDSDGNEKTYYLDVKDKKPKEKYLPEDEVIKYAHDIATKNKSVITSIADENEKITDCKYLRNYTDEDGFYHAVYEITKVSSDIDNPIVGVLKYPDFRYFASDGKWLLYDVTNDSEGDSLADETSVLLESVVGTWECNGGHRGIGGDLFKLTITVESAGKDKYKFNYNYTIDVDEEVWKSYREKDPKMADKFNNEINGSISVSRFVGNHGELFSFDGPGYGSQSIYIYGGAININSETYLNTDNWSFKLRKTKSDSSKKTIEQNQKDTFDILAEVDRYRVLEDFTSINELPFEKIMFNETTWQTELFFKDAKKEVYKDNLYKYTLTKTQLDSYFLKHYGRTYDLKILNDEKFHSKVLGCMSKFEYNDETQLAVFYEGPGGVDFMFDYQNIKYETTDGIYYTVTSDLIDVYTDDVYNNVAKVTMRFKKSGDDFTILSKISKYTND